MVAPGHFPSYDVATAFTNGARAVEPLAVTLPDTQLNDPGVPNVLEVVVPEPVVGVEPDVLLQIKVGSGIFLS